jgi:hypothetical protein
MSVSAYWKNLTSVALLGTERQNVPSAQGTVLENVLTESNSKEETLLDAVATASLYLRSGWQAAQNLEPALEVSLADTLSPMSKEMQECFVSIMQQEANLKAELFQLMAAAKVKPERGWVHKILEEARRNPAIRADVLNIIDERGRWLAKFLPVGDWVVPSVLSENLWDEGKLNERVAYLKQLRGTDAAKARGLLEESWSGEASESRADLLSAFEINLSLDDETFLESCLEDKKKDVRKTAASLLNSLPDSKLVQRMTERAKRFVTYKPAGMLGLKKAELEITLPETFEKDWAKDGIKQKSVPYGMGEKAWWLSQMLVRVPPGTWGEPKILSDVTKEWKNMFRNACHAATLTFRDVTWARYFLPDEAMMRVFPLEERQDYVMKSLSTMQGPITTSDSLWLDLIELPKPWNPGLEEALLKRVQLSLLNWSKTQTNTYYWQEQQSLLAFGQALPVSLLYAIPQALIEKYKTPDHPLREAFETMLTRLELRAKMHSVFGQ